MPTNNTWTQCDKWNELLVVPGKCWGERFRVWIRVAKWWVACNSSVVLGLGFRIWVAFKVAFTTGACVLWGSLHVMLFFVCIRHAHGPSPSIGTGWGPQRGDEAHSVYLNPFAANKLISSWEKREIWKRGTGTRHNPGIMHVCCFAIARKCFQELSHHRLRLWNHPLQRNKHIYSIWKNIKRR